jgi:hypothetical protein
MRMIVLAAVLALGGAGAAAAEDSGKSGKVHVVVCGKDGMAERALKREHGAVVWTTSAEVVDAVREGRGWSTPRCMSNLEHWRMADALRREDRTRQARAKAQRLLAQR